jgi:protein ImuB
LPIAALNLEDDHRIAISRAGLKTIGDLADRPSLSFAARFGEAMTLKLQRILGEAEAPLSPRRPMPVVWVERRFAEPIGRAEDMEAVLAGLAEEAGRRLGARREGGRVFEAGFFRADGAVRRITIETGRPVRDANIILRLFREKLDALADPLDPGFGFDLIRLVVPFTDPLAAAQTSLDGRIAEENEIADLVDRLAARFGSERVVRFHACETHIPEKAAELAPAGEPFPETAWADLQPEEPPGRPFHLFIPPQPITASMAEVPDGPPRKFLWRRKEHHVLLAEGPERIAPEWWRTPGEPARDYYRIEDGDGRRFWLYRTGEYDGAEPPRWYLHGLFA